MSTPHQQQHEGAARQKHHAFNAHLNTLLMAGTPAIKMERRGLFLGPKAENHDKLLDMCTKALEQHKVARVQYAEHMNDGGYDDYDIDNMTSAIEATNKSLDVLLNALKTSAPLWSMRHQGHMWWDQLMPAQVGYFAGMLFNQNNISAEAGPMTVLLEQKVGRSLCTMLGYDSNAGTRKATAAWGHLTSGGNVANIESMWAARNARFHCIALVKLMADFKAANADFDAAQWDSVVVCTAKTVPATSLHDHRGQPLPGDETATGSGATVKLASISDKWELVNIPLDETLKAHDQVSKILFDYFLANIPNTDSDRESKARRAADAVFENADTVERLGLLEFYATHDLFASGIGLPLLTAPATNHYSWPKGATLLGLGKQNLKEIHLQTNVRQDLGNLSTHLDNAVRDKRPVIMCVAVIGTTQENAVDDACEMMRKRNEYRSQKGLDFYVHADGAWGGYYASLIAEPHKPGDGRDDLDFFPGTAEITAAAAAPRSQPVFQDDLSMRMSSYVARQYWNLRHCDSITIDPHKAGYLPYPAGALCYRDGRTRNFCKIEAAVVFREGEAAISIWGIEGSKPGAAACAAYMAHSVVGPHKDGYGKMLGRCLFGSKRIFLAIKTLHTAIPNIVIEPLQPVQDVTDPSDASKTLIPKAKVDQWIGEWEQLTSKDLFERLNRDREQGSAFRNIGSDLVIVPFAMNFKVDNGTQWNTDREKFNTFNEALFQHFSVTVPLTAGKEPSLILTMATFYESTHGEAMLNDFATRLQLIDPTKEEKKPVTKEEKEAARNANKINYLISTTCDPWTAEDAKDPKNSFLGKYKQCLAEGAPKVLDVCTKHDWNREDIRTELVDKNTA